MVARVIWLAMLIAPSVVRLLEASTGDVSFVQFLKLLEGTTDDRI
jgi:hypothetical protein